MNFKKTRIEWIIEGGFERLTVDNVVADAGAGGATFATDDIGGVHYPRSKVVWGADGAANDTSAANPLPVVQTGTPALPTGAATAAKQPALGTAGTASADVITVQGIASGTALAVSAASLPLPSGAATESTLAAASAKLPATLGQKAMTASMAVALASDQSSIPVTGTFYQATQPVSAASLPLPTGAATLAEQQTQTTSLQLLDNLVLAEDAPHSSGDSGIMPLAVRRDANTSLVGTDGDYAPLQVNADGSLKVAITAGAGSGGTSLADKGAFTEGSTSLTPIGGVLNETISADPTEDQAAAVRITAKRALHVNLRDSSGAELTAGAQYAEDAAHASGDMLTMAGAVRRDTAAVGSGTDGDNSNLNVDGTGRLWTRVVGDTAHDSAISGNPVRIGLRAATSDPTSVANGDAVDSIATLGGKQIIHPYALPENLVSGAITSAMTGTTSTSLIAAPASGLRNYITTIIVSNSHATVGTDIVIQDGSGGTTLMTIPAAAVYGGAVISLPAPLRQPTTATAIFCANMTTGSSTKVSAMGFVAP